MLEVYLSLGHQVLVYLLAMIPSTGKPPSHRALVQAEGGHNGLEGAAMAEEGYRVTMMVTTSAAWCTRKKGVPLVAAKSLP